MVTPFDIFKTEPDGNLRRVEAAKDIDVAILRVEALGASSPGRYMIRSQETANKFYLDVNSRGAATVVLLEDCRMRRESQRPHSNSLCRRYSIPVGVVGERCRVGGQKGGTRGH